jgi:predicted TIM-barrel enzyme
MIRGKILDAWRKKRASGQRIAGGRSGPDFFSVSNEDKLRLPRSRGIGGLLPIGDANALTFESARERMAQAGGVPVLAGVCASDPLRLMKHFLKEIREAGVAGIQNAPTVGLIDGSFRTNLEEAGLGYSKEVEMVRLAADQGLITAPFVFSEENAHRMAEAGADLVVIHPGLGAAETAAERARRFESIAAAIREVRKEILVLSLGPAAAPGSELRWLDGIQTD